MAVIDADTHVIESELIWEFWEPHSAEPRPVLVRVDNPNTGKSRTHWLIDNGLVPRPEGKGAQFLATPPIRDLETGDGMNVSWKWRSLEDPKGRVADACRYDVDLQVVYPTIFIAYLTANVSLQVQLCRSYNRFMADRSSECNFGFRWVAVMPSDSIEDSIGEARFAKDNGAVGILFRGLEGDRSLADPYFFPLYAVARDLDLAICCHTGPGSPTLANMMDSRFAKTFDYNRMPPILAFHDICASGIPLRFPGLRWGFLEAGASFVPFMIHILSRYGRKNAEGKSFVGYGPELFSEFNIYVACESDEDIPYLAEFMGWDHLLIGTDYGHTDQSAELELAQIVKQRPDIGEKESKLMLEENPARFYGIT